MGKQIPPSPWSQKGRRRKAFWVREPDGMSEGLEAWTDVRENQRAVEQL